MPKIPQSSKPGEQWFKVLIKRDQYWLLKTLYFAGLIISLLQMFYAILSVNEKSHFTGNISLIILFGFGLVQIARKKFEQAVNLIFLIPIPLFFFLMFNQINGLSGNSMLLLNYSLIGGFIFLILFSDSIYKLFYFFLIAVVTTCYFILTNGIPADLITTNPSFAPNSANPLIDLTICYAITIIIQKNYKQKIRSLQDELTKTKREYRASQRNLTIAQMTVKVTQDNTTFNHKFELTSWNKEFCKLIGHNQIEIQNLTATQIFDELFQGESDLWKKFFTVRSLREHLIFQQHPEKSLKLLKTPISRNKFSCLIIDETNNYKKINALEESKQQYKVLLEAIPDLFFIIDKDGNFVDYVIKSADQLLINSNEIIGSSIFESSFSTIMARKIYQAIQNAIRFDTIETIEYAMDISQGTAMFEMRIAHLNDHQVIAIARDITKRKVAEIQLEDAKQKAEEADRLKSAFLANISHEIRTPMNAIVGFSKMLESQDLDESDKKRFTDTIIKNGQLLLEMLNDIISISKIETNQIKSHFSYCKINDLLLELYRDCTMNRDNPNVIINLSTENSDSNLGFFTDYSLLFESLKKLLDNALKFTTKGEIEFGYKLMDTKSLIRFYVKDTGIGIAPSYQKKIFDRFYQIDSGRNRRYKGTGLGLSIASYYVELLKGELKLYSKLEKGSLFYFDLPFDQENSPLKII